jgi:methionyl-tRNA synthetase
MWNDLEISSLSGDLDFNRDRQRSGVDFRIKLPLPSLRFKDRLLEYYNKNPNFIVPATRMNDVIQAVSSGLEDLSISRPVERLSWGIRVPDDDSQTIYVWLDALINYLP